jgi:hypothetical protein
MPVEADLSRNEQPPNVVGRVFVESASQSLESSLCKIEHCLAQLDEADVQWRQHESHNSIQNIILHLCGNLRQWILHGVGGAPDKRNRPLEFSDHRPLTKDHLAGELRSAVSDAIAVIDKTTDARLIEMRRIQGFDVSVLAAIFDSVSHFVGHTHQIVFITRQRLGDAYRFQWSPGSAEQGAAAD